MELVGGCGAPRCCYCSRSDGAVAPLCPVAQPAGASLAEYAITLGDSSVWVDYPVPVGCHGTPLQGYPTGWVAILSPS